MATLFDKLQKAGVQIYESTPLWVAGEVIIDKVTIGSNALVVKSAKYEANQLVIEDNGKRAYISLKNGVAPDKKEYSIQSFSASRDWEEYNIVAGTVKLFAV